MKVNGCYLCHWCKVLICLLVHVIVCHQVLLLPVYVPTVCRRVYHLVRLWMSAAYVLAYAIANERPLFRACHNYGD
jgi:hypothetical protein